MAHIAGITYVVSGRLFAIGVDPFYPEASSADFGLMASPVPVGQVHEPHHRIYAGAPDGTIYKFARFLPLNPITFSVGEEMRGSLAHADGTLYVGTGQGSLFALDDTTGDVRWTAAMGGMVMSAPSIAFQNGHPYRVIAGTGGGAFISIKALDPTTGAHIWSHDDYPFEQTVYGDSVYYADVNTRSLRARSVVDGSLLWQYASVDNTNFFQPAVVRNVVYATSWGDKAYAFDATGGNILWEVQLHFRSPGPPIVFHDKYHNRELVIFPAGEHSSHARAFLEALDARSGAHVWSSTTLAARSGEEVTPPILFAGYVTVGTADGRVIFVSATTGAVEYEKKLCSTPIFEGPRSALF
jgi:outer membrane protein assembly factor BamB